MKFKNHHHRKPRSCGGTEEKSNISIVDERQHKAWHLLFKNMGPNQIADKINGFYLDPEFKFEVTRRLIKTPRVKKTSGHENLASNCQKKDL